MSSFRIGMRLSGAVPARRCFELASMAEAFGLSSIWFAEPPLERGIAPAMGACAMAPVVLVNNKKMHDYMSNEKLDRLVDELGKAS